MTPAAYVAQRFGIFLHFSTATYLDGGWAPPATPIAGIAAPRLDCAQWISAVRSAGARYAVLTAKHADGFCLWPTRLTDRHVGHTQIQRDVVAEYVAACRAQGIAPGLYFCMHDTHHGPNVWEKEPQKGTLDEPANWQFVLGQLTELLTWYGPIACLWLDGCWAGNVVVRGADVPALARRVRAHIHSVQPDCIVLFNWHRDTIANGMSDVRATEVQCGQPCADNVLPHEVSSNGTTSHWFWREGDAPRDDEWLVHHRILPTIAAGGCHLLNLAPNRDGLLPDATVALCERLGRRLPATRLRNYDRLHVRHPAWTFSGPWEFLHDQHGSQQWVRGAHHAELRFTGSAVRLIGRASSDAAQLDLELDGRPLAQGLICHADLGMTLPRQILYERHDLSAGEHVLRVVVRPQTAGIATHDRCALEAVEAGVAT